ncbi:MAG: TfpX/TfpZ family type IV pilin accessory protein [Pseudomonadota bacterium]
MMKSLPRKRVIVSHFLCSLAIVATVLTVVYFLWYPAPYFQINGAAGVLKTLIGVDLVLGPALTVLLYKPGKKGLWFDMLFIGVLQLSALAYGTTVLYQERPQYMVFAVDRFVVVPGTQLYPSPNMSVPICEGSWSGPCEVAAVLPDDLQEREAVLFRSIEQGVELEHQPEYWQLLPTQSALLLQKAKPLAELADTTADAQRRIARFVGASGYDVTGLRYLPVVNGRLQAMTVVIDSNDASRVGVIAIDPWRAQGEKD